MSHLLVHSMGGNIFNPQITRTLSNYLRFFIIEQPLCVLSFVHLLAEIFVYSVVLLHSKNVYILIAWV